MLVLVHDVLILGMNGRTSPRYPRGFKPRSHGLERVADALVDFIAQDPVASKTPVTLLRFDPGRILSESTQGLMKASAAAIHDEPAKDCRPVRGSILAHIALSKGGFQ